MDSGTWSTLSSYEIGEIGADGAEVSCGSDLRPGEEARVGGAFFGGVFPRFFFVAAKAVEPLGKCFPMVTTAPQKENNGSPSVRKAVSKATISDSVEEWETTVCFLQTALSGKNNFGQTPAEDFEVLTHYAKEASVKSTVESSSAVSPIQPCRQWLRVAFK